MKSEAAKKQTLQDSLDEYEAMAAWRNQQREKDKSIEIQCVVLEKVIDAAHNIVSLLHKEMYKEPH